MSKTRLSQKTIAELWWKAAGRCEFNGCNKLLTQHGVTMQDCNLANCAHIIADSPKGPRGNIQSEELAKDSKNIMLMCPECHKYIDHEGKDLYSAEVLFAMKAKHEDRILFVTGIQPNMKSLVVAYGPKIGTDTPHFHKDVLFNTIFPERYPADQSPIEIQMKNSVMKDGETFFWEVESRQIEEICANKILGPLERGDLSHVSLFALGPQPLLVKLGTMLNDKYPIMVFQKHRVPDCWCWLEECPKNDIQLIEPHDKTKEPVLVIALSTKAILDRIADRFGDTVSLWSITCNEPGNDMMRSHSQLKQFNQVVRMAMDAIKTTHSKADCLKIFMAAPASCAVELGRIRMPKADLPWVLYDYWVDKDEDTETITIK